jgi:site-specific DNA-methyltransferase (adenine-specific)
MIIHNDVTTNEDPPVADLRHGDCLAEMAKLPDGCVDMVLTDPPYGTTACKWDAVIPLAPMWAQLKRLAKKNAAIVLHASQPFTSALVMSNVKMYRHEWIWRKNYGSNFLNASREPMKEHESVLVFSDGRWTYNPQREPRVGGGVAFIGKPLRRGPGRGCAETLSGGIGESSSDAMTADRLPGTVQPFKIPRGRNKVSHPTQKPVELAEYLIKTYTHPGMTVLDFTMGSGTTGVACKRLGRNFIGIELDAGYFEIAKKRIEAEAYQPNDKEPK